VEEAVEGRGGIGVNFAHVGRNLITKWVGGHVRNAILLRGTSEPLPALF
jgi:hypothetical protein